MSTITWSDFEKVDVRTGVVTRAEPFPEARRPALKLWIDFGPLGVKRSSAQITRHYRAEDVVGRTVVAEVLVLDAKARDLVYQRASNDRIVQVARE